MEWQIGTASATDPENNITGYSLSGADAGHFQIDSEGNITVAGGYMLDFETQQSHVFQVEVLDATAQSDTALVTVNVSDVAEDPVFGSPAGGGGWEFGISEMAHNDVTVGVISLSDPQDDIIEIKVYQGDITKPAEWVETPAFRAEKHAQLDFATLIVNSEQELNYEAKPEWDLILKAVDNQGNSDTTAVKITLLDEVEWGSTGTFIVSYEVLLAGVPTGKHHAEILIIPEDQEAYQGNGAFTQRVWVNRQLMVYTTIGAERQGSYNDILVSVTNRSAIDEDNWTQRGTVFTSGSANDMINLLFALDSQYGDDLEYAFEPEEDPGMDWNSNGYAHGLLHALEASDPNTDFNFTAGADPFPGWTIPVPLTEFGID